MYKTIRHSHFVKKILIFSFFYLFSTKSLAWNTPAKYVVSLSIQKSGVVAFTLSETNTIPAEFECKPSGNSRQWLKILPCDTGDLQCMASVNRMTSLLLSAKINFRKVHVHNDNCVVKSVALKP